MGPGAQSVYPLAEVSPQRVPRACEWAALHLPSHCRCRISLALYLPPGFSQNDQLSQGTLHTGSTLDSAMDHWNEASLPPFSVEPVSGMVPVGKTQKLKVKFSPMEVGDFESNLFCQ